MRTFTVSAILLCATFMLLGGCGDLEKSRVQNNMQRQRISQLESELQSATLQLDQAKRQLNSASARDSAEIDALTQKVMALEEDLAKKQAMIASMQQQLLYGGAQLPVELSTLLEEFAKQQPDMVTFDPNQGVVKFKSDLLFDKGSATIAASAKQALDMFSKILNTDQGKQFDVVIAGHTDDIRIGKPETRAMHPTNWHLSAHRGISVLEVLQSDGIANERMSVRGFGEFRPLEPNIEGNKGNPKNRRVEIFIVPKGA